MSSQRGVHNRIHTLRGEQFRHLQNLRGSRSHLTSSNIHTVPSLPFRLLSLADPSLDLGNHNPESPSPQPKPPSTGEPQPDGTYSRPPAGPAPPKSWTLNSRKDIRETATWRAQALSLVLTHLAEPQPPSSQPTRETSIDSGSASLTKIQNSGSVSALCHPRIPCLSLLCFQILLTTCSASEFQDEILPYIPPHLRKTLVRFTATHSPLSSARLYALWELEGHADGEMIVAGPDVVLKDDYFIRSSHSQAYEKMNGDGNDHVDGVDRGDGKEDERTVTEGSDQWEWDADEADASSPLTSLLFLNTILSSSMIFTFPPTISHLALISLSAPVPLHRLPNICPLLSILDISYNTWLGANFSPDGQGEPKPARDPIIKAIVDLGRIDWPRWSHMKVLGFRGNYVPEDFVTRVNENRWDDIEIVF